MAVERGQLCRNRENDNRRRIATKTISQPYAADGRGPTHARPGISPRSVCVGPQPSRVAQPELIARVLTKRSANNPGLTLFHCHQQLHINFGFMTLLLYID